jgi:hypothetical protein
MTVNEQGTYTTMQEGYYKSSAHNKTMMYEPVTKENLLFFYHRLKTFHFATGNSIQVPLPFIE